MTFLYKKKSLFFVFLFLLSQQLYSHIIVDAEFLYAQALSNDLEFALKVNTTIEDTSLKGIGQKENLHYNWNPGVRLGISNCFTPEWSLGLIGTYISSHAHGSASASTTNSNEFLHTLWFQSFTGFRAGFAEADWNVKFATADFIASYRYFPSRCLSLIPHFGLRYAYIKQDYDVCYVNTSFSTMSSGPLAFPKADVDMTSHFSGIGLTAGSQFIFSLSPCFSFNGGIGGSLLWGHVNVNEQIFGAFPIPEDILISTALNLPNRKDYIRANLEAETSLTYTFQSRCFLYEFSLGYFFSLWFDQNDFYNLVFTTTNIVDVELQDNLTTFEDRTGNLQLQGLFVRGAIIF